MASSFQVDRLRERATRLQAQARQAEAADDRATALAVYQQLATVYDRLIDATDGSRRDQLLKHRVETRLREIQNGTDTTGSRTVTAMGGGPGDRTAGADRGADRNSGDATRDGADLTALDVEELAAMPFDVLEPALDFSDVGGREHAKSRLREKVIHPIRQRRAYADYGLDVVNGVLLYGPPGTGKTYLAKALAGELGVTVVAVSGATLKSKFVGESEGNVKELFDTARQAAPCLVFVDEVDAILSSRGEYASAGKADMVGQFLQEVADLDGDDVFVVGTTNFPERLDRAAVRPGRFTEQLKIGLPPEGTRRAILRKQLEDRPVATGLDLDPIAEETHGYSAADLKLLVDEAALHALKDGVAIGQRELQHALDQTVPSVATDDRG